MTTRGLLDGLRAIRFLEVGGHPEPLLVIYAPPAPTNPFQRLLYAEGWSSGIASIPLRDLDALELIAKAARGRVRVVLHLHWLQRWTDNAPDPAEAMRAGDRFLARLDRLSELGVAIAWTVHNAVPHDVVHLDAAVHVRRGVVQRAALVHVLSAATLEAVAPWFAIPPERLVVVPHPSYIGVYPDRVSVGEARFELGLYQDELVHLAFGSLRAYKGTAALLEAWQRAGTVPPSARRLVVAGSAPPPPARDELVVKLATTPDVVAVTEHIPVRDVQVYFRAADVAVLAHRGVLNSGALLLALTFGLPVIAPRMPASLEIVDERVAVLYDPDDPEGLRGALLRAPELATFDAHAAAREIAERYEPVAISRAFLDELRRRTLTA